MKSKPTITEMNLAYRVIRRDKKTCHLILAALEERMRSLQEISRNYWENSPDEPPPYHFLVKRFCDSDNPTAEMHEEALEAIKLYEASPRADQDHANIETIRQFFALHEIYRRLGGKEPLEEFYDDEPDSPSEGSAI